MRLSDNLFPPGALLAKHNLSDVRDAPKALAALGGEPADPRILKRNVSAVLTAGYRTKDQDLGLVSEGVITPEASDKGEANTKTMIVEGRIRIDPPTAPGSCEIVIEVINGKRVRQIDVSRFDKVNGDPYTTGPGETFLFHIRKIGGSAVLTIEAVK
jgi:hypothetical protein